MALKFKCDNCQQDMIVRGHKVGDSAACQSCGSYSRVPESAENIEEDETLKTDGITGGSVEVSQEQTVSAESSLSDQLDTITYPTFITRFAAAFIDAVVTIGIFGFWEDCLNNYIFWWLYHGNFYHQKTSITRQNGSLFGRKKNTFDVRLNHLHFSRSP